MRGFDWIRRPAMIGIAPPIAVADDRDIREVRRQDDHGLRRREAGEECLQRNQPGRDHGGRTAMQAQAGDKSAEHGNFSVDP
jgi:hypothetical protein